MMEFLVGQRVVYDPQPPYPAWVDPSRRGIVGDVVLTYDVHGHQIVEFVTEGSIYVAFMESLRLYNRRP